MLMRTTLNLDDDIAALLGEEARQQGRSLSRVANDLMRAAMRALSEERRNPGPYTAPVFDSGRPKLDVTDISGVLDLLDDARSR